MSSLITKVLMNRTGFVFILLLASIKTICSNVNELLLSSYVNLCMRVLRLSAINFIRFESLHFVCNCCDHEFSILAVVSKFVFSSCGAHRNDNVQSQLQVAKARLTPTLVSIGTTLVFSFYMKAGSLVTVSCDKSSLLYAGSTLGA